MHPVAALNTRAGRIHPICCQTCLFCFSLIDLTSFFRPFTVRTIVWPYFFPKASPHLYTSPRALVPPRLLLSTYTVSPPTSAARLRSLVSRPPCPTMGSGSATTTRASTCLINVQFLIKSLL